MKRCSLLLAVVLCVGVFVGQLRAQDVSRLADEFYAGLADIIERNMNAPDNCLAEADRFYQTNQDKVLAMRKAAEKAMQQAAPLMEKYMSMSEQEAEALANKQQGGVQGRQSRLSSAAQRYTEAVKNFATKYPMPGMRLATLAMQLVTDPAKMQNAKQFNAQERNQDDQSKEEGEYPSEE